METNANNRIEKIAKLKEELKAVAARRKEYREAGAYEQEAMEAARYSEIVAKTNELEKGKIKPETKTETKTEQTNETKEEVKDEGSSELEFEQEEPEEKETALMKISNFAPIRAISGLMSKVANSAIGRFFAKIFIAIKQRIENLRARIGVAKTEYYFGKDESDKADELIEESTKTTAKDVRKIMEEDLEKESNQDADKKEKKTSILEKAKTRLKARNSKNLKDRYDGIFANANKAAKNITGNEIEQDDNKVEQPKTKKQIKEERRAEVDKQIEILKAINAEMKAEKNAKPIVLTNDGVKKRQEELKEEVKNMPDRNQKNPFYVPEENRFPIGSSKTTTTGQKEKDGREPGE